MTQTPLSKLNTQIYEEACDWLVHFRAGDADDDVDARRRLDEWLRRSPEHVRAYLEVSTIWEEMASHDGQRKIDAEAHIAHALSESNIYPLGSDGRPSEPQGDPQRSSTFLRSPFTLAAVLVLVVAATSTWFMSQRNVYSTQIGEQRSLILDDGSTVELNARSRLRLRFTDNERLIELLEGQALFRVAKDPSRPFVVTSGDARVRAVGTQFDVNRRKSNTTVTVIEGKVAVTPASAPPSSEPTASASHTGRAQIPPAIHDHVTYLSAGEQLTLAPKLAAAPRQANLAAATAWTQHRLVFDSVPLSEVAEEFNRYNKRPIVIRDAALKSFGVIGVFSSADPSSLLAFLRRQPEMEVTEGDEEIVISRK
jgi:transmembrane sensor